MKLSQKLFEGDNSLETVIAEARKQIDKNPNGHLPLPYRVKLNRLIADETTILKIWLECVKKADAEGDPIIVGMTHKATEFLYAKQGDKKYFTEFADHYRNHFAQYDDAYGFAGLTACWFGYGIAGGVEIEDYNGKDDDFDFEYEEWTPDFFASIAVSGGNLFVGVVDRGDAACRREFWNWYLDTVQTLVASPDKPVLPLKEIVKKQSSPTVTKARQQTKDTVSIVEKLNEIVDVATKLVESQEDSISWSKIVVVNTQYHATSAVVEFYDSSGVLHKVNSVSNYTSIHSLNMLFVSILKEMHEQEPQSGAWFACQVTIKPDGMFDTAFNYDDKDNLPQWPNPSIDDFLRAFKEYPRTKEFTPVWLQDIVKRGKLKYME